jgi:hypothetical protein
MRSIELTAGMCSIRMGSTTNAVATFTVPRVYPAPLAISALCPTVARPAVELLIGPLAIVVLLLGIVAVYRLARHSQPAAADVRVARASAPRSCDRFLR